MKKSTIFIVVIIILASIATYYFRDRIFNKQESKIAEATKKPTPVPTVKTIRVKPSTILKTLEVTGSVEAFTTAKLASPAEGPIENIYVREGDFVKKGEILATIGRKSGVVALIKSLREELKKEEDNLKAVAHLVETKALPAEQLDFARSSYEKVKAQLVKAEESAKDYSVIAPWDGLVSTVKFKNGEFVAPRTTILEIYDPNSLVIQTGIPENYAVDIKEGMAVDISLDAYPNKRLKGQISRIYPYLDTKLRTRTAEISVSESITLLPGMFARLKIILDRIENGVLVPYDSLIDTNKGLKVFVVKDSALEERKVKIGIETEEGVQIISGVSVGEIIVTSGADKLKNGTKVKPIAISETSPSKDNNSSENKTLGKVL